MAERRADPELESSTNRWMVAGVVLTVLLFLAFPIFRFYEPANRAEAREVLIESMVAQGEELYAANCASCHGDDGEGVDAPALIVEAGPAPNPGGLPIGKQARVGLPNDHLAYALTWYALAAALAVIYYLSQRGPPPGVVRD